jgi:hypothetical protein
VAVTTDSSPDSVSDEEALQIPFQKDVVLFSSSELEPFSGRFFDENSTFPLLPEFRPFSPDFQFPAFQFEPAVDAQWSPPSFPGLMRIRPPPMPFRTPVESFFLQYHRETITACHYFCYYDYKQRFINMLFSMSEQCDALRYAMIAFSAVIYSIANVDLSARERAFVYYAQSLQQLRSLLEKGPTGHEHQSAIATVLQLGTFDVVTLAVLLTSAPLLRFYKMLSTPYRCR